MPLSQDTSIGGMTTRIPRYFFLPGWQGSSPLHWQSRWQSRWSMNHSDHVHGVRVEQDDWHWPKRGDWMMRLDEALLADDTLLDQPAVLVAHSLGCHLVAAWAAHSKHVQRVRAAWLVAPPDLDDPARLAQLPPQLHGWRAVVRQRLPFAAKVLASSNDTYSTLERAQALALDWGAQFECLGDMGHVNEASGQGEWPEGRASLQAWVQSLGGAQ